VVVTLACDVYDRRPVVLLLHAFPLDRRMWRPVGALLEPRARVLAPDLPGFGASAAVTADPSLDVWADLVANWLSVAAGDRPVVVCGLSMGGYLALRLADRHPDRLAALVLADTGAGADGDADRAARNQRIAMVTDQGVGPLVDALLPRLLGPTARPEVETEVRRIAGEQTRAGVTAALAAMRDRPDSTRLLTQIRVPALVVVGADDALTPPSVARSIAEALPHGRLRVIPGAGHLSAVEAPDAFARALVELLDEL
jgi:pimeloyl-ACP methyl ester carboxylesterase